MLSATRRQWAVWGHCQYIAGDLWVIWHAMICRCSTMNWTAMQTLELCVLCHVCQMITADSLDVGSSYLHIQSTSMHYGSSSYMKVIGSRSRSGSQEQKKVKKFLFPQCKTSIGNNSHSIKHRAELWCLRAAWGFPLWQIERCNCRLCQMTGSELM